MAGLGVTHQWLPPECWNGRHGLQAKDDTGLHIARTGPRRNPEGLDERALSSASSELSLINRGIEWTISNAFSMSNMKVCY